MIRNPLVAVASAGVLTVFHLLAVTWRLLQSFHDHRCGRWNHRDGGLTVLDGEADGDLESLPVAGCLGDVVTDLLGRETKWADLGGER